MFWAKERCTCDAVVPTNTAYSLSETATEVAALEIAHHWPARPLHPARTSYISVNHNV